MGTRAQFFIGNPEDVAGREWLGCIAWDGYPDGECRNLAKASSEVGFRALVNHMRDNRDDFCDPEKSSFPFPWMDDVFITDCTYALFDGAVHMTWFHQGWIPLVEYLSSEDTQETYHNSPARLPRNVPAPRNGDKPKGPDSIMIIGVDGRS